MAVTFTDIKNRLKAGYYYQLALDSNPEWDETTTYSIDEPVRVYNDDFDYYVPYKSLTGSNLNNNPLTDAVNWVEYSEITEQCITEAELFVESFVINRNHTYDDTNRFQKQAIILYASGLLIDSANQMTNSDGDETPGIDEKTRATVMLDQAFQLKAEDAPAQSPYAYVSNANGNVRTLAETDPNEYYNDNYSTNDLGL